MNHYIFALAALLICALVVVAILAYKLVRAGAQEVGGTVRTTSKHVADTVRDVAAETIAPISKGVGHIADAVASRIETRQKELHHLRDQVTTLTARIEHLKNQHVSVDQIVPVLKLALVSVDLKATHAVVDNVTSEDVGWLARREVTEYLGIFDAVNTQRLGVDMNRLRFRKLSDSLMEVRGLAEMEVVGNINTAVKLRHCELRQHHTEGTVRPDSHVILQGDLKDSPMMKRQNQQRDDVHAMITRPEPVKVISEAIENLALQFLKTCFAPAGVTVVKATAEFQDGKTLEQICDDINGRVSQLVSTEQAKVKQLEDRLTETEKDLREDVKREFAGQLGTVS